MPTLYVPAHAYCTALLRGILILFIRCALFAISLEQSDCGWTMASNSRYSVSEVLGLLNSENLDDFGLLESEDSECDDEVVGCYLPEVQPEEEEL